MIGSMVGIVAAMMFALALREGQPLIPKQEQKRVLAIACNPARFIVNGGLRWVPVDATAGWPAEVPVDGGAATRWLAVPLRRVVCRS